MKTIKLLILSLSVFLIACDRHPLNNPYPKATSKTNVYYSSFAERPRTLDPAKAYSSNEYLFIAQIYEPPLQYHYLKRPYTLMPLTVTTVPKPIYYDKSNRKLAENAPSSQVAYSVYTLALKPHRYYQPHPAFAKNKEGKFVYRWQDEDYLDEHDIEELNDFKHIANREVTADDYVYEIKRLAHPDVHSPILGLMSGHIVGMKAYAKLLRQKYQALGRPEFFDLRKYDLTGVHKIDRYHYQIKINGKYPQFKFWLAMPFFAALPWEADAFYAQPGMDDKNISLDWYPVGSGPFMLAINNPNREMVLSKNPNFGGENFPAEGEPGDKASGLLAVAGKPLPFIEKAIFTLEKETIPRWTKFLQGYYDLSGISSDSFDQAVYVDSQGQPHLTQSMRDKKIRLDTTVGPSIYYIGFNMLDDVVGGYSEKSRKLRQAISIAIDYEEFIAIFLNGRGIPAQGPIPPSIFGYQGGEAGINSFVYEWKKGKVKRKPLAVGKQLLVEAGYPNGRDAKTGKPLVLNYDIPAGSGPDDKARFDWMRKQFAKLGIQLHVRATQYNRFQEKMRTGNAQIFFWGWNADYPDPENFLFLLYGPNSKVKHHGENAANYNRPEYNKLFARMKNMPNNSMRQAIINKMVSLIQRDAPWVWAFHPKNFALSHDWVGVTKPNEMANNTLKYMRIEPKLRAEQRLAWNKPIWWPVWVLLGLLTLSVVPIVVKYRRKTRRPSSLSP